MEKNPKFNKRRAFNKAVGPGKKSKINKRRAYVYSGIQSSCFLDCNASEDLAPFKIYVRQMKALAAEYIAHYVGRAVGISKILVGTSLCGGHNLPPLLDYLIKIYGDQLPCSNTFRRPWVASDSMHVPCLRLSVLHVFC